ncbi:hypothetical protein [Pseudolactococcus insecticola]|uniref:Transcriptional regulator n=1 Tax=Pseudolactococcus insecticola TaxID=2709158 RepID=A0A6A0B4G9_9LACT|nr:hypothetical protein [Lactococcus insecticola]GFH40072.1 hypothetical protein Hs20B_04700 [Lactococcus insecticola]
MENFDYYRKMKNLKVTGLDPDEMSRGRFYRLMNGDQKPTIDDLTTISLFLNLSAYESTRVFYNQASIDNFLSDGADTTNDIWDSPAIMAIILETAHKLRTDTSYETKAYLIFSKIRHNKYIQTYFINTVYLIDLLVAEHENKSDVIERLLKKIYNDLVKREIWTTYEIALIFILSTSAAITDLELFWALSGKLDSLSDVAKDDYTTLSLITNLRFSLFETAIYKKDNFNIKRFYQSLQKVRQDHQMIYISFLQKLAEVIYLDLLGHPEDAAQTRKELMHSVRFILDNHLPDRPNETHFNQQYQLIADFTNEWRKEEQLDAYTNLLS